MKSLGLIPARGGSRGVPKKNKVLLGGKPLIVWTIEAALAASNISRVLVSTDDPEIAEIAKEAGAEAPFIRPENISNDTTPAHPVISHALSWLEENDDWISDYVAYLQPTSPFRTNVDIDQAFDIITKQGADTVVSVVRVPHNMVPASLMRLKGPWIDFTAPESERQFRRQSKEQLFARNGPAILLNKTEIVKQGKLYGESIAPYEMSRLASIDIDEQEDFDIAEALLSLIGQQD